MRAAGLSESALAGLVCPIGAPVLKSKDPAVIAASTAAQLLVVSEQAAASGEASPKRAAV
jgi:xanthine dehydrogenase accessory factor